MSEDLVSAPEEMAPVEESTGKARLVLMREGAETDIDFIFGGTVVIGRFDPSVGPIDVDLHELPEGSYVSRRHAQIVKSESGWVLKDLGSSNGTWVLTGPVDSGQFEKVDERDLADGDIVAFGNARFAFHLEGAATAAPDSSEESGPPEPEPVEEESSAPAV